MPPTHFVPCCDLCTPMASIPQAKGNRALISDTQGNTQTKDPRSSTLGCLGQWAVGRASAEPDLLPTPYMTLGRPLPSLGFSVAIS